MDKLIIGLSGKKGSGKDTVCQLLQSRLGHGKRYAFADPIKEIAAEYFGIPRKLSDAPNDVKNSTYTDWLWEEIPANLLGNYDWGSVGTKNGKTGPMTVREVLQWIGTEIFRNNMHKDFWVRATFNRIKADKSSFLKTIGFVGVEPSYKEEDENLYFITDVRFPNEVKSIKDSGGLVIRVYRPAAENKDTHPSETSLDEMDRELDRQIATVLASRSDICAELIKTWSGKPYDFAINNDLDLVALDRTCDILAAFLKEKFLNK